MRANQIAEFKYVTLIKNMLTKQWHLEKALDVARGRMDYEKLLPKQRITVEAFICIHALTSRLQEELLSWLPSIVFDHLQCSMLTG